MKNKMDRQCYGGAGRNNLRAQLHLQSKLCIQSTLSLKFSKKNKINFEYFKKNIIFTEVLNVFNCFYRLSLFVKIKIEKANVYKLRHMTKNK